MENRDIRSFAVITGASSGIGQEVAKQLAERGYDLLIVGSTNEIEKSRRLLVDMGAEVDAIKADLATFRGTKDVYDEIRAIGRPVDVLVLNAGVGEGGPFLECDLKDDLHLIRLNIISPLHLSKMVLRDMVERGRGKVMFTSSISALTPVPFEAVYAATKSFLFSFSESIRNELKNTGVSVTCLLPGPTNTNFFNRAGMNDTKVGAEMKYDNEAREVARQGIEAMMAGKDFVVAASFKTKLQGLADRILPEWVKAEVHRRSSEPGSAHH